MGSVLLSNPPYNLQWEPPSMAGFDQRFMGYGIPPKNNANYAFVLTGVNLADKSCFFATTLSVESKASRKRHNKNTCKR